MAALMAIFLDDLVYLFGCTETLYPYAIGYGRIIIIGLPFVLVGTVLTAIERADGSPKYSMMSLVVGAVTNTILDPIFIFIFKWGVEGAAIATIIGQMLTCFMGIYYIKWFKTIAPKKQDYMVRWSYCKKVIFVCSNLCGNFSCHCIYCISNSTRTNHFYLWQRKWIV